MAVAERFSGFHRRALANASGTDLEVYDLSHDADRGAVWGTAPLYDEVHRWDEATLAHQQAYALSAGFGPEGVAYSGSKLYVSNGTDTIKEFTVGATSLTEDASYTVYQGEFLAWDGTTLWVVDENNNLVTKRVMDASLSVDTQYDLSPDTPHGLVFASGKAFLLETDDTQGEVIRERSPADMSVVNTWPYTGDATNGNPRGVAFSPNRDTAPLLNGEPGTFDVLVRPSHHLQSLVTPQPIYYEHLASAATVRLSDLQHLPASVWAGPAWASLGTLVKPRFHANLPGTVEARFSEYLSSTVQPTDYAVEDLGQLVGHVIAQIVVESQDFRDVSAEVGSQVTHRRGGVLVEKLDRVIQLVESTQSKTYPRTRTSEYGAGFAQDRLRRGDAVLYAVRGDDLRPGDIIEWQGQRFEVVGGLGWHYVGNVRVYQELGLRRLPVVDRGRVQGTVNTV